ncbi:MAG: hypothetical protein WDW38_008434 [Sanguina aurantia]
MFSDVVGAHINAVRRAENSVGYSVVQTEQQQQRAAPFNWLDPSDPYRPDTHSANHSHPDQHRDLPSRSAAPPPAPTVCRSKQNQQQRCDNTAPIVRFSRTERTHTQAEVSVPYRHTAPNQTHPHQPGKRNGLLRSGSPSSSGTSDTTEQLTGRQAAERLTRDITTAASLEQLSRLVSESQRCMNPIHISAALSKLSRMHGSAASRTLKTRAMLTAASGTSPPPVQPTAAAPTTSSTVTTGPHTPPSSLSHTPANHPSLLHPDPDSADRSRRGAVAVSSSTGEPDTATSGQADGVHALTEQLLDLMYYWLLQSQAGISQAAVSEAGSRSGASLASWDPSPSSPVTAAGAVESAAWMTSPSAQPAPVSHELEGGLQPRQLAVALHALARLGHAPGPRWWALYLSVSLPLLDALQFRPQELSMLAWGSARLGLAPGLAWMTALCTACAHRSDAFNSQENSTVVWALASIGHAPTDRWLACWTSCARSLFPYSSAYDLSQLTWGLAKLSAFPAADHGWVGELLSSAAVVLAASPHPQDMCNMLWGLAVSGVTPGRGWLDPILRSLVKNSAWLRAFKPVDTALLIWGLARLQHRPSDPRVLDVLLLTLIDSRERDLDEAALAPCTECCAGCDSGGQGSGGAWTQPERQRQTSPARQLAGRVASGPAPERSDPRDLAHVMWGLAALQFRPSRRCRQALLAYLQDSLPAFSPQPAAMLLWAHHRLHLHLPQRVLVEFAHTFAAHAHTFTPQGVSLALYSFLRCRFRPSPALIERLILGWLRVTLVHTVHLLPQCSIQQLVNLVWGLAAMDYRPAELWLTLLVSSVTPRLVAGEFSPQAVHVLLWALARLEHCPAARFWLALRAGVAADPELLKYPGTGKSIARLRSLVALPSPAPSWPPVLSVIHNGNSADLSLASMDAQETWEAVATDGEIHAALAFFALLASVLAGLATGMQLLQRHQNDRAPKYQTNFSSSYNVELMLHSSYSDSNDSCDGPRNRFSIDALSSDMPPLQQ